MNTALCQLIGITLVEAKPVIRWEVEHRREVELEAGRQHAAWLWNFNVTVPGCIVWFNAQCRYSWVPSV